MNGYRDRSDDDFLRILRGLEPATIQDLCEAAGVTATAVRQRLGRLSENGLVRRQMQRQDRGRPFHTYEVTEAGLRALGDDHAEIAAILWREMMRIDDPAVRSDLLNRVKNALVERFGVETSDGGLVGRLHVLCSTMTSQGFDVEYGGEGGNGLPILRENNCPWHGLVAEDPSFCDLETSVFAELLGVPVERSSCRLDGHRCCEFQVGRVG